MGAGISDNRVLSVLSLGTEFRRLIDPEGLLRKASVRRLTFSGPAWSRWKMLVVFPSGLAVMLYGILDDAVKILGGHILDSDETTVIPVKSSSTLMGSLGTLSMLPANLKSNLSVPGSVNSADSGMDNVKTAINLGIDALFFGVEGGAPQDGYRSRFSDLDIRYIYDIEGIVQSLRLQSFVNLTDARISVVSGMDLYGLKDKSVCLEYNLGMGRHISSDCYYTRDGKTIPSLRLAFDLAEQLSGIYVKQRRKKESMGKPKISK